MLAQIVSTLATSLKCSESLKKIIPPSWNLISFSKQIKTRKDSIAEFESLKGSSIILEVNSQNYNAIKLYEKQGFKQISKRKAYYSDGNDALVLQKLLEGVIWC